MTSLSLPRVLHPRKTSLEIEREHFEKAQSVALSKAINDVEAPVKEKHVRSAIIGTYHTQGGKVYWSIVLQLRALDDAIVAWKFCHVTHKVLREGHPLCLVHSQRHVQDLDEIGKLWVHLKDGYGAMIRKYTRLLMIKLDFHKRNPRIPGPLGLSPDELDSIGGQDINNYFQLSVEMFDYLDGILELQAAVFGSMKHGHSNSMTSSGQCRLAPLIPCVQDATRLYDHCVKIMFKLHSTLPSDLLVGHRERFFKQFRQLKEFYEQVSNKQYFKDLITIQQLPENPPNFAQLSDLRTYRTQEIVVPEPEEDLAAEGNLIDTTDSSSEAEPTPPPLPPNHITMTLSAHQEFINEREMLKQQCERLGMQVQRLMAADKERTSALEQKIASLETDCAKRTSELEQERQLKEDVLSSFTELQTQKSDYKSIEDKYNQLNTWYQKVRSSHLVKLSELSELQKKHAATSKTLEAAENTRRELEEKIVALESEVEDSKRSHGASLQVQSAELEGLKKDKELFDMETEILRKSVEDGQREREKLVAQLKEAQNENAELKAKMEELGVSVAQLEATIKEDKARNEQRLRDMVKKCLKVSEDIVSEAVHEVDNPAISALMCSPDYLKSLTGGCEVALQRTVELKYEDQSGTIVAAEGVAHRLATFIVQARATCNCSPDINLAEKMAEVCKDLGTSVIQTIAAMTDAQSTQAPVASSLEKLRELSTLADTIQAALSGDKAETLADMLESEMLAMDKAIEEAAAAMQQMLEQSRAAHSGIKLEVSEKILDSCNVLMAAIRVLIQRSKLLQQEIVAQGRGTATTKEFYKRNSQWTDGFISAAKAVAAAAKFLLAAADKVVTSNGKLESLVVASQEISASTAQLVVASRVKADRHSGNLHQLTDASKKVTGATAAIVATVKDCSQMIDDAEELDVSNLTLHQAKRLEMESRVKLLELEKEVEMERQRLAALKRHHYQLAEDDA